MSISVILASDIAPISRLRSITDEVESVESDWPARDWATFNNALKSDCPITPSEGEVVCVCWYPLVTRPRISSTTGIIRFAWAWRFWASAVSRASCSTYKESSRDILGILVLILHHRFQVEDGAGM